MNSFYEKNGVLVFVIGWTLLGLLGCGEDIDAPPANDWTFRRQLIGQWQVVSINDMEPSRFLTVLMVEPLNEENSGDVAVPAAPSGEFVIVEDEPEVVYHVKSRVSEFLYGFGEDDSWVLGVRFWIYPNDEATPVGEDATDASGDTQRDPIDPEKPEAPPVNITNQNLGMVDAGWGGTFQVLDGMLILTIETEDVEVTPHPDTKDYFEGIIADASEDDPQAELAAKFNIRLINPFSKTFISKNDDGSLSLSIPGSSRGNMRLERWMPHLDELILD